MADLSTEYCGRAGELLVCLDFVVRGFAASLNAFPASPCDVLVDLGDRSFLRVQVKTTRNSRPGRKNSQIYKFQLRDPQRVVASVDLFAFVALDARATVYVPAAELRTRTTTKGFGAREFLRKSRFSLDRFLAERQMA